MLWLSLILVSLGFLFSLLATLLPILPGTLFAALCILAHKLVLADLSVSWSLVLVGLGAALLAQVIDLLLGYWGARRFGATWKGALGGVIGGIIGALFFNIPGILLGPIIGAFVGEWFAHKDQRWTRARRAGIGTLIGGILGMLTKWALTIALIIAFYVDLPPEGWPPIFG